MALTGASIFDYCERTSAAFWAEPLNAVTNAGFIVAALAGIALIARRPPYERSLWHAFFVADFIAIGIGSFLFHTMPGKGTELADIGPIGLFMLTYLVYAIRRFAGATWFFTAAAIAAFIAAMAMAFNVHCWEGRVGFTLANVPAGARAQCMNGSLGYGPAFAAMLLLGGWLAVKRHKAASADACGGRGLRRLAHPALARPAALRGVDLHGPSHGHALPLAFVQLGYAVPAPGGGDPAWRKPGGDDATAQGKAAGLWGPIATAMFARLRSRPSRGCTAEGSLLR